MLSCAILQLPFLLLFDLRFSSNSQSQMPLLTDNARGVISLNGRTLRLFKKSIFILTIMRSGSLKLDNTGAKTKKDQLWQLYHDHFCTAHTLSSNICLVS